MVTAHSKIIIVGGGVFGLSTALWLARGGYKDITIFDRCPFDKNFYDPANGCDGASSDLNKVFRMAYGDRLVYQDLAIEVREMWLSWNRRIAGSAQSELPSGLCPEDVLLHECGNYFVSAGSELAQFYRDSLDTMERTASEFRRMQFIRGDPAEEERLRKISPKWVEKLHVVDKINGGDLNGFIDIKGGVTIADKACVYAKFLCEQLGVKFVLGDPEGTFSSMITETNGKEKRVIGIRTGDGRRHFADLVIVAAGGWTASILPEAANAVETTAGTVAFIDIPKGRKDLWERFHPDNYPVWSFRYGEGENYYQGNSFPISKGGRLKFGFRGRKFTNFEDHPSESGLRVSTPRTKYTKNPINTVPLYGLSRMKKVIAEALPDLAEFDFSDSRLCWYTDSIDNNYVIDYVPGYSNSLFICTGGSGHGFKFLPILGRHVKNQLERVPDQFTSLWKWRVAKAGQDNNGLGQGDDGPRNLSNVEMALRE
ncbi:hypothetical protein CkaCkLH20_05317 [Colletotrichum karsti]|uniref:FAD dependent oxidoreductase domain-containing protein n=1 Tax=Colletotrichum karsti TaxID=1095194 RepID=A0A9P6LLB3_9PEZI|nr:uncharacterized protein CkaCkLH20_05317 [Colletotrichum karsti]KAF9877051.1 hypothetical protein CkaCkLH20_05317 [Colletotrichum karsti]